MSCAFHSEHSACDIALRAQQPIFDSDMRVVGYELLYRSATGDERAKVDDPRQATLQVIAGASLEIGLDVLVGAVPAFVNFPQDLLMIDAPLPSRRIFIEVLECVRAEPEAIRCLNALRDRGYRVVLDDFRFADSDARPLDVADAGKIDMATLCDDDLERAVAALRMLAALQNPELNIADLELLISRDLGISYRLLRCINPGFYNLPRAVRTLHQALVLLALDNLRRLCTLVTLSGFDDRPAQLLVDSMVSARMRELLAQTAGVREAGPCFVTGMFSLLDALLGRPLPEALDLLPLAPPIRRALFEREGELGAALRCVLSCELGDWEAAEFRGLAPAQIRSAYLRAVRWAEESAAMLGIVLHRHPSASRRHSCREPNDRAGAPLGGIRRGPPRGVQPTLSRPARLR
jgi:Predicted signal transduction protein containing EAL and modified HD-GYP domains